MSDDIQVAVVNDSAVVAVSQPNLQILADSTTTPVVIESPAVEIVTLEDEVHIVDEVRDIQIITVGEAGPAGPVGADGASIAETYIAAVSIGGDRITVTNASGQLIYADVNDPTHATQAVRITTQAANAGASINVQVAGRITEPSWTWTPGATLYVGANALPTETAPVAPAAFSKVIAVAETATRILIVNEPPVMLA